MEALLAFMAVDEQGIGALRYTTEERARIAQESRNYQCPSCHAKLKVHEELIISSRAQTEERRVKQNRERLHSQSLLKEAQAKEQQEVEEYFLKKSMSEAPAANYRLNQEEPRLQYAQSARLDTAPEDVLLLRRNTSTSVTHSIPHPSGKGTIRGVFGVGQDPSLLKTHSAQPVIQAGNREIVEQKPASMNHELPNNLNRNSSATSMMDEPKKPTLREIIDSQSVGSARVTLKFEPASITIQTQRQPQGNPLVLSRDEVLQAISSPHSGGIQPIIATHLARGAEDMLQTAYLKYVEEVNRFTYQNRATFYDSLEGIVTDAVQLQTALESITFEENEKLKEEKQKEAERKAALAASRRAATLRTANGATTESQAANGIPVGQDTDGSEEGQQSQTVEPSLASQSQEYQVLQKKLKLVDTIFYGLIAGITIYFLFKLFNLCAHMF